MALTKVQSEMAGAGQVLQVVQATTTTQVSTTSTSYVTTGLTVSITPRSASNKILILCNGNVRTANNGRNLQMTVYRNALNLELTSSRGFMQLENGAGASNNTDASQSFVYMDSPATTSSTTYTIYMKAEAGQSVAWCIDNTYSGIIVMEIAG